MSKFAWSYSSLDLFKQCPHKYFRLKVKKDVKEPYSPHLIYGNELHKAAEHFVRDNTPLPEKFAFAKEALEVLREREGQHLCEYRMGLTRDLEPCGFSDAAVWWRGIADLLTLQGDLAYIVDYKTGASSKYADTKQLEILALAVFKHFPYVQRIKAGLLFVNANDFIPTSFETNQQTIRWEQWIEDASRLEQSIKLNVWNPRPNFTCKAWCPVLDCPHNGKGV